MFLHNLARISHDLFCTEFFFNLFFGLHVSLSVRAEAEENNRMGLVVRLQAV